MSTTTDRNDPELTKGIDNTPVSQSSKYLVLSEEERSKGFVRPLRYSYIHNNCGALTTMNKEIAETYARNPFFYGATYCCGCRMHRPLGEFEWEDGSGMGE